jgi:excisionase family DNA binding protein
MPTASNSRTPPLLTCQEAAEFLGVPVGTLAQWRSQRRGPQYIKLEGRLVRYRLTDLESYLSERLVPLTK